MILAKLKIFAILGIILALLAAAYYIQDYGNVRCTLNVTKASQKESDRKSDAAAELAAGTLYHAIKSDRGVRDVLNSKEICANTPDYDVADRYGWVRPKNDKVRDKKR